MIRTRISDQAEKSEPGFAAAIIHRRSKALSRFLGTLQNFHQASLQEFTDSLPSLTGSKPRLAW
jgi:negative regulator of replication initiation